MLSSTQSSRIKSEKTRPNREAVGGGRRERASTRHNSGAVIDGRGGRHLLSDWTDEPYTWSAICGLSHRSKCSSIKHTTSHGVFRYDNITPVWSTTSQNNTKTGTHEQQLHSVACRGSGRGAVIDMISSVCLEPNGVTVAVPNPSQSPAP